MKFVLITISDDPKSSEENDKPVNRLMNSLKKDFSAYTHCHNFQADEDIISKSIIYYADVVMMDVIITIGGSDSNLDAVATKATLSVIEKRVEDLLCSLTAISANDVDLSLCGVRNKTLILNFPRHSTSIFKIYNLIQPVFTVFLKLAVTCMPTYKEDCIDYVRKQIKGLEVSECIRLVIESYEKSFAQTVNQFKYEDLLGAVCAEDISSRTDHPARSVALIDGYGCNFSKHLKSNAYCVVGEKTINKLQKGECVLMKKGNVLPDGVNIVVSVKDTELLPNKPNKQKIRLLKQYRKYQNIKFIGSVLRKGLALKDSQMIGPTEIGIYTLFKLPKLLVYVKPTVGIFSTAQNGELNESCTHRIFFTQLSNLFGDYGFPSIDYGVLFKTDPNNTIETLIMTSEENQVMIVVVNELDSYVKTLFQRELCAKVIFENVNLPNGKDISFLTYYFNEKRKYIFTVPDNLLSTLIACRLLIVPTLMHWIGLKNFQHMKVNVIIDQNLKLKEVPQFLLASLQYSDADNCLKATNILTEINNSIITSDINAILEIPSNGINIKMLPKGSKVTAMKLNNRFQ